MKNKKPEKLRECLDKTEELFSAHQPVCISWMSSRSYGSQLLYISLEKSLGSFEEKGEKLQAADPKCSLLDIP